jgi:hypothetical protein
MVRTLACDDPQRLVDTLLGDPRFDAMLDHDFHLADVRRRVDASVFAHLARLHAASAAALYLHEPRQVRTAMTYALATRDKRHASVEQAIVQLRRLTHGAITATAFDEDHNSIVRAASARRLAHFLSGESVDAEPA